MTVRNVLLITRGSPRPDLLDHARLCDIHATHTHGIPARSGFLLCAQRTHARDDFTPGESQAEFDGLDEAVERIEHWLASFDAAPDFAARCHAHVMARHNYAQRAAKLHAALLAWHAGKSGVLQ